MEHEVDQLIVNTIKTLSMDAVQAAQVGAPRRRDGLGGCRHRPLE